MDNNHDGDNNNNEDLSLTTVLGILISPWLPPYPKQGQSNQLQENSSPQKGNLGASFLDKFYLYKLSTPSSLPPPLSYTASP